MSYSTLVAGVGNPLLGDLDFGPHFARRYGHGWPPGVLVEDAAVAAQLFLHRLQEVDPTQLIIVAGHPWGGSASSLRHRRPDPAPPPGEVHERLGESVSGVIDLEHVLAVCAFYGALPADTWVVEVEPADVRFGPELSAAVEMRLGEVAALVRALIA